MDRYFIGTGDGTGSSVLAYLHRYTSLPLSVASQAVVIQLDQG